MQVVVSQQERKSRYFHLSGSLKRIGKYIGRGNRRSIAAVVVQNSRSKDEVVSSLCKDIQAEVKTAILEVNYCLRIIKKRHIGMV